ncbi:MAG: CPBP family glutamic-type intramembrane protease [Candidatus Bathyarchaeota archaeon]|nr:CPBP family glutamic-type intramembrane protease [Candidatus Bathyarchaeum sp.]
MISEELKLFCKLFVVVVVIFTVAFYALSLVLGPILFYFTPDGLATSMVYTPSLPAWLLIFPVTIPISFELGAVFVGVSFVITSSFIVAWKLNSSFHQTIKNSVIQPTKNLFQNSLFGMVLVNSMTLIAVLILNSLQEATGIPTGTTPTVGQPFLDFLDLSYSAVIEEIGFRLIPIGAFLFIVLLITKKADTVISVKQKIKLFFFSFLFPDKAKQLTGNKTVSEHGILTGISISEWGMIVFTAVIFGMAHYNPGVSWEIGKISSATLTGFILALTYFVYGAHAPFLMHWFFNTYHETYFLLADLYPEASPLANTVVILTFVLGLLGWITVTVMGFTKLTKSFQNTKTQQPNLTYDEPASIS